MQFGRSDLADFNYFLAVAKHRSFRRAALELGVSGSALSHAIKGLEARLGVRLLNRTNRSVTLTAAGEALRGEIATPFDAIGQAVENLNRFRDAPTGRIRLNVPSDAAALLLGPVLPIFIDRYPDIEIDLVVTNRLVDVTDGGFDAGIRYGGTVPEDMVAQRLSADIRWVLAATPAYLERFGEPRHPDDLQTHRCLRFKLGDDTVYRWEFERGDEHVEVSVPGPLILDDSRIILILLLGGGRADVRARTAGRASGFDGSRPAGDGRLVLSGARLPRVLFEPPPGPRRAAPPRRPGPRDAPAGPLRATGASLHDDERGSSLHAMRAVSPDGSAAPNCRSFPHGRNEEGRRRVARPARPSAAASRG